MTIKVIGKRFTDAQIEEGTDVDEWIEGLDIKTLYAATSVPKGTGYITVVLVYEEEEVVEEPPENPE